MIIKPHLPWPKLSKLKVGDIIKWKEEHTNLYLNPYITIDSIQEDENGKLEHTMINGFWFIHRFEVKIR